MTEQNNTYRTEEGITVSGVEPIVDQIAELRKRVEAVEALQKNLMAGCEGLAFNISMLQSSVANTNSQMTASAATANVRIVRIVGLEASFAKLQETVSDNHGFAVLSAARNAARITKMEGPGKGVGLPFDLSEAIIEEATIGQSKRNAAD